MTQPSRYTDNRARQIEALNLRRAGLTYREIAERVGYSSDAVACRAVQGLLKRTSAESVEELRATENDRLDRLQIAVWADAMLGNERAVLSVLRILERRAKLNGLDAPVRQELTGANGGAIRTEDVGLTDAERMEKLAAIFDAVRARDGGSSDSADD